MTEEHKTEAEEESVEEEEEEPADVLEESDSEPDTEPLTSEEIKRSIVGLSDDARHAAIALIEDAKDVWIIPVNKAVRSRFKKARKFFSDLGGE
jgi:hypothetical protein